METKKPIAIIGAGIAGLTAANFLKENKVPFILYEASNKLRDLQQVSKMLMVLTMILEPIS